MLALVRGGDVERERTEQRVPGLLEDRRPAHHVQAEPADVRCHVRREHPRCAGALLQLLPHRLLRCDQAAVESAKETVHEVIGRTLHDQLRIEAMWGYALCAANPTVTDRSRQFFDKTDRGRAGATSTPL